MAITWINPVELTLTGSNSTWNDLDVSAHISAAATGVILHIHMNTIVNRRLNFRKNGSTDNFISEDFSGGGHIWVCVGVDANGIFEFNAERVAHFNFDLVGYFEDDAVFFTNAIDKSFGSTNSFTDVDISRDTGADTAIAAFFTFHHGTITRVTMRKNGSGDDFWPYDVDNIYWPLIGVDANEICEVKQEFSGTLTLQGYLTKDATFLTNATDLNSGATNQWVDKTLPAGATGAFIHAYGADDDIYGARKNNTSFAWDESLTDEVGTAYVEAESEVIELYRETGVEAYLVGYSTAAAEQSNNDIIVFQL